ncbi:3'(2'),5'-bisphosphate nucleotidase CysQ [Chryseosolibacter indicus]|uniref:3'(2'),5'-bisphosphate nucleotidase CysQ n=1 Tax=Chryseosolibacter indicus TaxID=2782351 RepID=A0ABS5VUZ6_9BACT|nr:3'(2'),5'-bisphosphate nucleotidase CysQ [Chryseosolibacter indicus]MBT1704873.1 3'(2'),5'-bisphosphate nucleotidase CysQ [Chryseosolibacter indicus]
MDLKRLLDIAIDAAEAACVEILDVYHSADFGAEAKQDNSPLTLADKRAHLKITSILAKRGLPILSEEGKNIQYEERKNWEYFWMVDPLDGTKEFIKRNGEFTVNIALIHRTKAVLGVVAIPVTGAVYSAFAGGGAWIKRKGAISKLPVRSTVDFNKPGIRVVASRSHMNTETEAFIGKLREPILVSKGSSLKFMMLAEGEADVYPRYAPTMEWDTAAPHVIINEIGLQVLHIDQGSELIYNKPDLLNPYFLVQ